MKKNTMPALLLFTLLVMGLFASGKMCVFSTKIEETGEEFMGTDPYTRMVRAKQLRDGGDWFDSIIMRSNAPYGEELHWTRPMDVAIIGMSRLFARFMDQEEALEAAGLYVSPVFGVISIMVLMWGAVFLLGTDRAPLALIVYFSQFFVLQYFDVGRPDHHSLIMLMLVTFLSVGFRFLQGTAWKPWAVSTAFAAAFAFWVSVETIIFPVIVAAALTIGWLAYGGDEMERLEAFSLWMLAFTSLFLLIERAPYDLAAIEYDKISYPYIVLFAALAAYSIMAKHMAGNRVMGRLLFTAAAGPACLMGVLALFPGMAGGPFSGVNPEIVVLWLRRVTEVQSIATMSLGMAAMYIGLPIACFLGLLYMTAKGRIKGPAPWRFILIGLAVYIPLSVYQVRWTAYAQTFAVFPAVLLLDEAFRRIGKISSSKWRGAARMGTMLILCLGFFFVGLIFPVEAGKSEKPEEGATSLREICEWMNSRGFGGGSVVLADIDAGPQILYRTDMRVIATPYHRNDDGILFYYNTMAEEDMEKVFRMMRERSVRLVLQEIPVGAEVEYDLKQTCLRDRLMSGRVPAWMNEIEFPDDFKGYRLYEINLKDN